MKIIKEFDTFQEASDALRWLKLEPELRKPERTDLYQSKGWRAQTPSANEIDATDFKTFSPR